jgi:hypothetical protein
VERACRAHVAEKGVATSLQKQGFERPTFCSLIKFMLRGWRCLEQMVNVDEKDKRGNIHWLWDSPLAGHPPLQAPKTNNEPPDRNPFIASVTYILP